MFGGPDSSVGIVTGYGLDGPGIESRWGARFSAPVQTSPGVHPASCTMGTGSFRGVKSGRGVMLTPHPLLVPWSWKGRATSIPLLPLWAVWPVQCLYKGALYLTLHVCMGFLLWESEWISEYRDKYTTKTSKMMKIILFSCNCNGSIRPTAGIHDQYRVYLILLSPIYNWVSCQQRVCQL
jgi:hypothetical protein